MIGTIKLTARTAPPTGWLLCNGASVSRTDYADLFEAIGTTYGAGDESTTFNLPDLRGRVSVGQLADDDVYTYASTLGTSTGWGACQHQLSLAEMPRHTHSVSFSDNKELFSTPGGNGFRSNHARDGGCNSLQANAAGGNQPHNNMPPYLVLNYIIKAEDDTREPIQLGARQNMSITAGETAHVPNISKGTLFWVGTTCGNCFGMRHGTTFFLFGTTPGSTDFLSQVGGLGTVDLETDMLTITSVNAVRIYSGGTISHWNSSVVVHAVMPFEA